MIGFDGNILFKQVTMEVYLLIIYFNFKRNKLRTKLFKKSTMNTIMKVYSFKSLCPLLLLFFLMLTSCSKDEDPIPAVDVPLPTKTLKESSNGFFVGMAMNSNRLDMNSYTAIIEREFESMTSEWEMKMNIILPSKGNYNWSKADKIVNYCVSKGINIHGHALIWHSSTPDWLENYSGTDAQFEQEVKEYITAVVTRYKDKVSSWDVVNEGVADQNGELRNTVFRQRMGDDYMAKCFQWAREADSDCKLFYNDYNMTSNISKQNKVFELVADWKKRNIPIDGLGYQMHISYNFPSKEQIKAATDRAVDTGLLLHYSELDIRANPNKDIIKLTAERSTAQQLKYKEVVQIYNTIPTANKFGITVWGLKDNDSWLLPHHNNTNEWPLLYDANFKAKKAYTGFLEGLQ